MVLADLARDLANALQEVSGDKEFVLVVAIPKSLL
jgi:hypothetical protein